jgi:hypothetical protein
MPPVAVKRAGMTARAASSDPVVKSKAAIVTAEAAARVPRKPRQARKIRKARWRLALVPAMLPEVSDQFMLPL